MAWTAPATAVAGTVLTAAFWNTHVRDNELEVRGTPAHHCDAYHNTTQTVNATANDVVALNAEAADTSTMHDTVTNNERVTIPAGGGGRYHCLGHVHRSSGAGVGRLHLRVDGTAQRTVHSSAETDSLVIAVYLTLTAAQYVDLTYEAISNNTTIGSATAAHANRLVVYGPLPPS